MTAHKTCRSLRQFVPAGYALIGKAPFAGSISRPCLTGAGIAAR